MKRLRFTPEQKDQASQRLHKLGLEAFEVTKALVLWEEGLMPLSAADSVAFEVFAAIQQEQDGGGV